MACIVSGNEIILTGTVGGGGWWWDEDCFCHSDVITALAQVGRDADITVRVNSGGGIATEGAAIHAAFAQHKGKVGMVVEGWAASAASLFIMAGTTITMRPGALLMIHDPSSSMWGPAAEHRRCADALDVMANTFAQVYADRTGKTPEEMRAVMRAETWLGPVEAVAQGFADAANASNDNTEIEPVAFSGVSAYMRAPERIVVLAKAKGWGATPHAKARQSAAAPETAHKGIRMSAKPENPEASAPEKPADATPAPVTPEAKADAAAIAEACAAAGMPATMAVSLMKAGATMTAVNARIEDAKAITSAATLAGMHGMGAKLVAAGVSLDAARDLLAEVRTSNDDAVVTNTAHSNGAAPTNSGWGAAVAKLKK